MIRIVRYCVHIDGFQVVPADFSKEILKSWSATKLFCQQCGAPVYYRHGQKVVPHFAHVAKSSCESGEPETLEHLEGKQLLKKWIEHLYPLNITRQEVFLSEIMQRADILTIFPDGRKLCIEYQCSPISDKALVKRMEGYDKANISQVWVLGEELFKKRLINRFRLHVWEKIIWKRQGVLYRFDSLARHPVLSLMIITGIIGKKTLHSYEDKLACALQKLIISPNGRITTTDVSLGLRRRETIPQAVSPIIKTYSSQYLKWEDQQLQRRREDDFSTNPLRNFAISRIGDYLSHPLINQSIKGDELFLIDHRLWQSYLFLTEIHRIYQRKSVFSRGTQIPKICINHILIKDSRFPERPFQTVLKRYINHHLSQYLHTRKQERKGVKMIHELVYEYFCRLENLGFLRNITPKHSQISAERKMFGSFEVLFDRFCPDIFGTTESEVKLFFQQHRLRYLKNVWFDISKNKKIL